MVISLKKLKHYLFTRQPGNILVLTLVFFTLGVLLIGPALSYLGTLVKSGVVFEKRTDILYAADAGIEDARWNIQYDMLESLFQGAPDPYSPVDFRTLWPYSLTEKVNRKDVDVTIENVWMPRDLDAPLKEDAERIIGGVNGQPPAVLISSHAEKPYQSENEPGIIEIQIQYYPDKDDLAIKTLGVWLPPGYSYAPRPVTDPFFNRNIDAYADSIPDPSNPVIHLGGEAVIWTFTEWPFAGDTATNPDTPAFPGVDLGGNLPLKSTIVFYYRAEKPNSSPRPVAWIDTNLDLTQGQGGQTYTWDGDVNIFHITSVADNTSIEAYVDKSLTRTMSSAVSGDYYATGNSLMSNAIPDENFIRDSWINPPDHSSSSSVVEDLPGVDDDGDGKIDESSEGVPRSAEVSQAYLYWTAWKSELVFSDYCQEYAIGGNDQDEFINWNRGSNWSIQNQFYDGPGDTGEFRCIGGGSLDDRTLNLENQVEFSSGSPGTVSVFWDQHETGILESTDQLKFAFYNDNSGWSSEITAFAGDSPPGYFSYAIPSAYLDDASGFKMKFVFYSDMAEECVYIDNIRITIASLLDYCNYLDDNIWNHGYQWSVGNDNVSNDDSFEFRGQGGGTEQGRTLELRNGLDLNTYEPGTAYVSWEQTEGGILESSDELVFAFYDQDSGWSHNLRAFCDDTPERAFLYKIPDEYLNDPGSFKIRFYYNFNETNEYVFLDNIKIFEMKPDRSVFLEINGERVYWDSNGNPRSGTNEEVLAGRSWVIPSVADGAVKGYYYSCVQDVTALVKEFTRVDVGTVAEHSPGIAKYTVGNVDGRLGIDGGDFSLAHSGWSLVIIYTSLDTKEHQVYLFDRFTRASDSTNLDFDQDGSPGGDISGFIVPPRVDGEENVAAMTVFGGEGDDQTNGDYIKFNGMILPDGTGAEGGDVWNGLSTITSAEGVDIDVFDVTWDSRLLVPGDTSARIDMYTERDNWNLIYVILSFRSKADFSGPLAYEVH